VHGCIFDDFIVGLLSDSAMLHDTVYANIGETVVGKNITKSSVHLTAFVLQLLITSCSSYIYLPDVHLTATISLYTSFI
jgi:hypothetical protein